MRRWYGLELDRLEDNNELGKPLGARRTSVQKWMSGLPRQRV